MRLTSSLALIGSFQFGISGPWDCHVYAVAGPEGIVLIDSGGGTHTERLLSNLTADLGGKSVRAVLVTHAHADHIGGAASLRETTQCQVMAPEASCMVIESGDEDRSSLAKGREQGIYPSDFHLRKCKVDHALHDGEEFMAAGLSFRAVQICGHSKDSFAFYTEVERQRWIFTGDIVFYGGVLGVINAEGSGMDGYRADLEKLAGLNVDGLFPGHGLFTLQGGQQHMDCAIQQTRRGFLPRQIGQGDIIF